MDSSKNGYKCHSCKEMRGRLLEESEHIPDSYLLVEKPALCDQCAELHKKNQEYLAYRILHGIPGVVFCRQREAICRAIAKRCAQV